MCGIYGMVALDGETLHCPELLEVMSRSLRHRGPDGRGVVRNRRAAMGTERLRIVDLHERADQPFADPSSRCWLACNGEIYNAAQLRRRYPDYPYRSHSDVETILPLYLDKGAPRPRLLGACRIQRFSPVEGCRTRPVASTRSSVCSPFAAIAR